MTGPNRSDDFKRIWQGQSTEDTKLTLEQVREKARSVQLQKHIIGFVMLPVSIGMTIFLARFLALAWMEHRPAWLLIVLVGVCLHGVYHSITLIRTRRIDTNAGFKTSLEVYRAHFEVERALTPRVWSYVGLLMLAGVIAVLYLWIQLPIFPARDAFEFAFGAMLIGVLVYLGIRHKNRQIDRALHMVDGLERDIE